MADEKIIVRFNGSWTKYFQGDVAGFEPHVANKLLKMAAVDSRGNRHPLVTRQGSFVDRLAVNKAAVAEPVASAEVVGPDSEELVGGPVARKRGRSKK